MDLLRNQIQRISQQLAGLNATQKMLAMALVFIMGMSLVWWTQYSGQAEMSYLGEKAMAPDELTTMTAALSNAGIKTQIVNNRILVPTDSMVQAMSVLSYSLNLPTDTQSMFESMLKNTSPFDSPSKQREIQNEYRQNRLGMIIRGYPGVANAMVAIDATNERGPNRIEPTATVSMTLKRRGETPSQQLVIAAADLVSGAIANLQRSKVKVIVDGVSYPVKDRNSASIAGIGDDNLSLVQKGEEYYHDKLASYLHWLNGAFFAVSVQTDNTSKTSEKIEVDPKSKVQITTSEKTSSEEDKSSNTNPEAGLSSNAPMVAGEGASGSEGNVSTRETSETTSQGEYNKEIIRTIDPGGTCTVSSAAVHVPRSYFIRSYQVMYNSKDEPSMDKLDPYIAAELKKIKPHVMKCLNLKTEDSVAVDVFTDLMPTGGVAAGSATGVALSDALTGHVKEIALGVLALASLFMASNIVRKNTPAPATAPVAPKTVKPAMDMMDNGELPVGEAIEGMGALEAVELDDEETRSHQMQQQVADLVNTNPDVAANLVKRWLNRS